MFIVPKDHPEPNADITEDEEGGIFDCFVVSFGTEQLVVEGIRGGFRGLVKFVDPVDLQDRLREEEEGNGKGLR